jgi:hypothetical protein
MEESVARAAAQPPLAWLHLDIECRRRPIRRRHQWRARARLRRGALRNRLVATRARALMATWSAAVACRVQRIAFVFREHQDRSRVVTSSMAGTRRKQRSHPLAISKAINGRSWFW